MSGGNNMVFLAAGGAAGGAAGAAGGAAGGALTPLIMQAQFLGIAGQIGGPSALPASVSGISEGLAWTNFHLIKLYSSETQPVERRRGIRRQADKVDDCSIARRSPTELGGASLTPRHNDCA